MKRILFLLMLTLSLTTLCGTLDAQPNRQRMTREQLAEVQARHIAKELAMDDATAKRFTKTFCQYQKDVWALGPRPGKSHEATIEERFDHSQKILDLRRKYYRIYRQFLSERQIKRVYEVEKKMMQRLGRGQRDRR